MTKVPIKSSQSRNDEQPKLHTQNRREERERESQSTGRHDKREATGRQKSQVLDLKPAGATVWAILAGSILGQWFAGFRLETGVGSGGNKGRMGHGSFIYGIPTVDGSGSLGRRREDFNKGNQKGMRKPA